MAKARCPLPPIKVGLGVFLAVATSLFALLISAYHMRMMETDWTRPRAAEGAVAQHRGADRLASIAMQWTRRRRNGDRRTK
mgnify:CR=1 FL=1